MSAQPDSPIVVAIGSVPAELMAHRAELAEACLRLGLEPRSLEDPGGEGGAPGDRARALLEGAELYLGLFDAGLDPGSAQARRAAEELELARGRGLPRVLLLRAPDGTSAAPRSPVHARLQGEPGLLVLDPAEGTGATRQAALRGLDGLLAQLPAPETGGAAERPPQHPEGAARPPAPPEPLVAHPYLFAPRRLIGRSGDLDRLAGLVGAEGGRRLSLVAILGPSGVGKSALAWQWLWGARTGARSPEGRIWWSFYGPGATYEGLVLRALAYVSGRTEAEIRKEPPRERERQLLEALDARPFLLVLDGAERLLRGYARMDAAYLEDLEPPGPGASPADAGLERHAADTHAGNFLRKLARLGASRVLLTARLLPIELEAADEVPIEGAAILRLSGLADDDALELWHAAGALGERDGVLTALRSLDGEPLLTGLLAADVASSAPDRSYQTWLTLRSGFRPAERDPRERRRHVFEHALAGLEPGRRKTLEVVAALRLPASIVSLRALLVRGPDGADAFAAEKPFASLPELDRALTQLEDRGLVGWDRRANRYDLQPLVRGLTWKLLGDQRRYLYQMLKQHFESLLQEGELPRSRRLHGVTPAVELYHTLIGLGRGDEALLLFRQQLNRAGFRQRIEALEQLVAVGRAGLPRLALPSAQSWTLTTLGILYHRCGEPGTAVTILLRKRTADQRWAGPRSQATSFVNLATTQLTSGRLRIAEASARSSLLLCQKLKDRFVEGVCLDVLGLGLIVRGEADGSAAALERSLRIWQAREHEQLEGSSLASLAERLLWLGDGGGALELAGRAHEIARKQESTDDLIRTARIWGAAALLVGGDRLAEAEERLRFACGRAGAVSFLEEEVRALVALAELRRQRGELDASRELLEEAWAPLERGPFPLFHVDALEVLTRVERDAGRGAAAVSAATRAYRLAWCDGPPFAYQRGLEGARRHLEELGAPPPELSPHDPARFEPLPEVVIDPPDEFGARAAG